MSLLANPRPLYEALLPVIDVLKAAVEDSDRIISHTCCCGRVGTAKKGDEPLTYQNQRSSSSQDVGNQVLDKLPKIDPLSPKRKDTPVDNISSDASIEKIENRYSVVFEADMSKIIKEDKLIAPATEANPQNDLVSNVDSLTDPDTKTNKNKASITELYDVGTDLLSEVTYLQDILQGTAKAFDHELHFNLMNRANEILRRYKPPLISNSLVSRSYDSGDLPLLSEPSSSPIDPQLGLPLRPRKGIETAQECSPLLMTAENDIYGEEKHYDEESTTVTADERVRLDGRQKQAFRSGKSKGKDAAKAESSTVEDALMPSTLAPQEEHAVVYGELDSSLNDDQALIEKILIEEYTSSRSRPPSRDITARVDEACDMALTYTEGPSSEIDVCVEHPTEENLCDILCASVLTPDSVIKDMKFSEATIGKVVSPEPAGPRVSTTVLKLSMPDSDSAMGLDITTASINKIFGSEDIGDYEGPSNNQPNEFYMPEEEGTGLNHIFPCVRQNACLSDHTGHIVTLDGTFTNFGKIEDYPELTPLANNDIKHGKPEEEGLEDEQPKGGSTERMDILPTPSKAPKPALNEPPSLFIVPHNDHIRMEKAEIFEDSARDTTKPEEPEEEPVANTMSQTESNSFTDIPLTPLETPVRPSAGSSLQIRKELKGSDEVEIPAELEDLSIAADLEAPVSQSGRSEDDAKLVSLAQNDAEPEYCKVSEINTDLSAQTGQETIDEPRVGSKESTNLDQHHIPEENGTDLSHVFLISSATDTVEPDIADGQKLVALDRTFTNFGYVEDLPDNGGNNFTITDSTDSSQNDLEYLTLEEEGVDPDLGVSASIVNAWSSETAESGSITMDGALVNDKNMEGFFDERLGYPSYKGDDPTLGNDTATIPAIFEEETNISTVPPPQEKGKYLGVGVKWEANQQNKRRAPSAPTETGKKSAYPSVKQEHAIEVLGEADPEKSRSSPRSSSRPSWQTHTRNVSEASEEATHTRSVSAATTDVVPVSTAATSPVSNGFPSGVVKAGTPIKGKIAARSSPATTPVVPGVGTQPVEKMEKAQGSTPSLVKPGKKATKARNAQRARAKARKRVAAEAEAGARG